MVSPVRNVKTVVHRLSIVVKFLALVRYLPECLGSVYIDVYRMYCIQFDPSCVGFQKYSSYVWVLQ